METSGSESRLAVKGRLRGLSVVKPDEIDFFNYYDVGPVLGVGHYAEVKLATHKGSGEKFAVKVIDRSRIKTEREQRHMKEEIEILQKIHHPHIVSLKEVVTSERFYFLVLELVEGGELFDRIVEKTSYRYAYLFGGEG
jgi:serine/threonine protein kinase